MYSLSITLLTLKGFGLIDWSWWQCAAPGGLFFIVMVAINIVRLREEKRKKEEDRKKLVSLMSRGIQ